MIVELQNGTTVEVELWWEREKRRRQEFIDRGWTIERDQHGLPTRLWWGSGNVVRTEKPEALN